MLVDRCEKQPPQWCNQFWQNLEEGAGKQCSECLEADVPRTPLCNRYTIAYVGRCSYLQTMNNSWFRFWYIYPKTGFGWFLNSVLINFCIWFWLMFCDSDALLGKSCSECVCAHTCECVREREREKNIVQLFSTRVHVRKLDHWYLIWDYYVKKKQNVHIYGKAWDQMTVKHRVQWLFCFLTGITVCVVAFLVLGPWPH